MAEFKFFCPQCGQQVQCDTGYSGTQINCPACKQTIVVPQAPGSTAQPPVPAKSHLWRNVLVVAASVVVLAGLVTTGWFGYSKLKRGHLPPGLVSLWSGEGNGSDSVDGNKAVLTDISFEEGKVGRAFSFNGTTSTITIPASPSLDIGADAGFTIMAWIKPLDVNGLHPIAEWSDNDCPLNFGSVFDPLKMAYCAATLWNPKEIILWFPNRELWSAMSSSILHLHMTKPAAKEHCI